ncbi:MAG: hypothetical protein ACYDEV_04380 [Acidiferrobacter sp.]
MIPLKRIGNSLYAYRLVTIHPDSDGGLPCPSREWVLFSLKHETPEEKAKRLADGVKGIAKLRAALNDTGAGL